MGNMKAPFPWWAWAGGRETPRHLMGSEVAGVGGGGWGKVTLSSAGLQDADPNLGASVAGTILTSANTKPLLSQPPAKARLKAGDL